MSSTGSISSLGLCSLGTRVGLAAIAVCTVALSVLAAVTPAQAAGRVDLSPAPNADAATVVTLSGSGFQYQPNAPGGIYVTFGVVADPTTNSWAPSQGGKSGSTFGYASTAGATLLVGFLGGSSAESSAAVIDEQGNWTAQLTIPGSTFPSSSGNPHANESVEGAQIDCTQVQCGIITFGAHGMVNTNNESFTPVSFVASNGELVSGVAGQSFSDEATKLDLGAATETPQTEASGASSTDAVNSESGGTSVAAEIAPVPASPSDTTPSAGGLSSTALVLGAVGFALAALVAAIGTVTVRRVRERKTVQPATQTQEAPHHEKESV